MPNYTSYYLYQRYEKVGDGEWTPTYPNEYSISGDSSDPMPLVIKTTNDPNCGYYPPIYRWTDTDDTICVFEEDNPYANEYLTLDIVSGGTLTWDKIYNAGCQNVREIYYSKGELNNNDEMIWVGPTSYLNMNVNAGDKVYFKGLNKEYGYCCMWYFGGSAKFNAYGNIMSMIYGDDFVGQRAFTERETFNGLFRYSGVIDASNLVLPVENLTSACYAEMFIGCTSLINAPELPSTNLSDNCYAQMFDGCSSLTAAPVLPATIMKSYCYAGMFRNCTSLATAPELPSTTLADNCYREMFNGCTFATVPVLSASTLAVSCYREMFRNCRNLTSAPVLSASTMAEGCYYGMFRNCTRLTTAPTLSSTTLALSCYYNMFNGCTSLVNAPALPATTLADSCYSHMFEGCSSLTTAPDLPAVNLISGCYWSMFYNCSSLNYIKAMFTKNTKVDTYYKYTQNWVYGVSSSGTFVKNTAATWNVTGSSGVPSGWTIQTVSI